MRLRNQILALLGVFVLAESASAATFYAATTGDDMRSCGTAQNINTPKQTLNSAYACLSPGDTLLVRGGMYDEMTLDTVPSGTSWSNKVRIASYLPELVTITPSVCGAPWYTAVQFGTASEQQYIEFDGINIDSRACLGQALKLNGIASNQQAHHIRFQNATIQCGTDNAGASIESSQCIVAAAGAAGLGESNEFINLTVTVAAFIDPHNDFGPHCFYIESANNLLEHNDVSDCGGNGIQLNNSNGLGALPDDNIVRFNRIHDITRANNAGTACGATGCGRHRGIVVANGSDNLVYGNVIWNITSGGSGDATPKNSSGIQILAAGTSIYNNTIVSTAFYCLRIDAGSTGTMQRNNICKSSSDADYLDAGTSTTSSHNMSEDATGEIQDDPEFVDEMGEDFRLDTGSPAIDVGFNVSAFVTLDIDGTTRPDGAAFDLGAYEYFSGMSVACEDPCVFTISGASTDTETVAETAPVASTGSDLLVAIVADFALAEDPATPHDSEDNTWELKATYVGDFNTRVRMYVATAPIVGVGHTFDLPAGDNPVFQQYPCMVVFGFNTASVIYRSQTGASSTSSATLKPGAIATTRPNALLIAGISHSGIEGPPPISDDFLQPVGADSDGTAALSYGCAGAYRVVVSAGTADPEWTIAPDGASTALLAFQDVADDVISRHPRLLRRLRIH